MAYECPVCDHLQADLEHLANHLAITAIARGGVHETWLDERVDGWTSMSVVALAAAIEGAVAETSASAWSVSSTDDIERQEGTDSLEPRRDSGDGPRRAGALDDATRTALERARDLTRRRRSANETDSDTEE